MSGDLRMSPFDVIDGTLIVPCNPGHIELRLENGMLVIQRWVFVRPMMGVAGHSQMIASMRIPLDAVRALESALGQPPMSNGPGGSAASTQVSAQTRTPEGSNTPVPDVLAGGEPGSPKGEGQKEVTQHRLEAGATSPQRASGAPRRSTQAKDTQAR